MATRRASILVALFGTASAELAVKVDNTKDGMVAYQPNGMCIQHAGAWMKFTCNAAKDSVTIDTFPGGDCGTASGTKTAATPATTQGEAVANPVQADAVILSCEDVTTTGHVESNAHTAGVTGCSANTLCDRKYYYTDVCQKASKTMDGGYKSMVVKQDGRMAMFGSEDCTGPAMVMQQQLNTCKSDPDACGDGVPGFTKNIATPAASPGAEVAITLPVMDPALVVFMTQKGTTAQMPMMCKPEFQGSTNIIEGYSKMGCHDANNIVLSKYAKTDSACSGTAQMVVAMPLAAMPGSSCGADTSTGTLVTKLFSAAGCDKCNLCGHSMIPTGVCLSLGAGQDVGGTKMLSMKYTNDPKSQMFETSNCSGAATEVPEATGCAATSSGNCNDGTTIAFPEKILHTQANPIDTSNDACGAASPTTPAAGGAGATTAAPAAGGGGATTAAPAAGGGGATTVAPAAATTVAAVPANTTAAPANTTVLATTIAPTAAPSAIASSALSQGPFVAIAATLAFGAGQIAL